MTGFLIALLPLLAMFLVAAWGLLALPPGTRIPIHYGFGRASRRASRSVGLLAFPLIGTVLAAFELLAGSSTGQGASSVALPTGLILLLLLVFQLRGATRAAPPR